MTETKHTVLLRIKELQKLTESIVTELKCDDIDIDSLGNLYETRDKQIQALKEATADYNRETVNENVRQEVEYAFDELATLDEEARTLLKNQTNHLAEALQKNTNERAIDDQYRKSGQKADGSLFITSKLEG